MELRIKRNENEILNDITDYLSKCDADDLARIFEDVSGRKCSFVEGMYDTGIHVNVMGSEFLLTVNEVEWATEDKDGSVVIGFVPAMAMEEGELYAIKASVPRKGAVGYTEHSKYENDMSKLFQYLLLDSSDASMTNTYNAFIIELGEDATVETYLRQNSPAAIKFLEYINRNDGNYMTLTEGNGSFTLCIWDSEDGAANDDGSNCTDGGVIPYTTDIEREFLCRFENRGEVTVIYSDEYNV